jgi:hypothetical protein
MLMTAANIEAAFGTALVSVVNNADWPVFPATRDGQVPDDSCVIVRCENARHLAGGFYQADIEVMVVSSSLITGEVETAVGIAQDIHDWLRETPAASAPGITLAGVHVTNSLSVEADRRWMQTIAFTCGLRPV